MDPVDRVIDRQMNSAEWSDYARQYDVYECPVCRENQPWKVTGNVVLVMCPQDGNTQIASLV